MFKKLETVWYKKGIFCHIFHLKSILTWRPSLASWKPECVLSFNTGWRIKLTNIRQPMLKLKHILSSINYFDSYMSKSTNTVVYFDWRTVIYIYVPNGRGGHAMTNIHYLKSWFCLFLSYSNDRNLLFDLWSGHDIVAMEKSFSKFNDNLV
jgi:hypothetical protein